jgi:hypothetical protein
MTLQNFRNVQIGDTLPPPATRGLRHYDWQPAWHIFTVPPRGELPATAWLARNGVAECWHPTETAFRRDRFKPNKRIPYERPVAPGYLFAVLPFCPNWDVLFYRARGKLLKVVSHNGEPIPIPESEIGKMRLIPKRLADIREAEAERQRINPGDRAVVEIAGIEWQVTVDRIHAGIAHFIVPLLGGREVQKPVSDMVKQPLA